MTIEEIDALVAEARASFIECEQMLAQADTETSPEQKAEDAAAGLNMTICPACSFEKRLVEAIEWLLLAHNSGQPGSSPAP
jgi:hypothetical protein